jgi:HlyD family secretion protein
VELDDRELRAQRDRAVAAQRSAEARWEQARTSRDIKNAAAKSDHQRAQQALATAKTRLAQAKELASITDTEVDTRYAAAEAGVKSAKERLKALQEGARRQEERAAELQVARALAQLRRAQDMYRRRAQLAQRGLAAREEADNARRDVEVAQAELNVAREQMDLVKEGPRSEEIRIAEEGVRQAEAALQEAGANRARRKVSNQDVDAADQQVQQAQSALDAAKAALAQSQWNEDEIRSAEAAVNQARADIRFYDEQLSQTRVYSPVDGIVSKRDVNVGQSLTMMMSAGLMTIVSADTLYFEATAPESALPYLSPGDAAEVTLDAMPGRTFRGVLREIIPVAEGEARAVRLRISLPRPEMSGAVVGGFARATLKGGARGAVISVPRAAVISDEGETAVYLYGDGKAHWQAVRLGRGSGPRAEVIEGLRPGDRVIVDGAKSITDGQVVRLKGEPEG